MRNLVLAITLAVVGAIPTVAAEPAVVEVASPQLTLFAMDYSKDGDSLVIGGSHGLWVYSLKSEQVTQREPDGDVRHIACSPIAEDLFVTWSSDHTFRLRRIGQDKPVWEAVGDDGFLMDLEFFPDGELFAASGYRMKDGKVVARYVRIIDAETGKTVHLIEKQKLDVSGLAVSADSQQLAVCLLGREKSAVQVFDRATWKLKHTIQIPDGFPNDVAFVDDGKNLLMAGGKYFGPNAKPQRDARLWLAKLVDDGSRSIDQLSLHDIDSYREAALSKNGKLVAVSTNEGRSQFRMRPNKLDPKLPPVPVETGWQLITVVQLRDAKSGELVWSTDGNNAADVYGLTMSPDQKQVVFCSAGTVIFVDVKTGETASTLSPPM